jgi:hypothetical protein
MGNGNSWEILLIGKLNPSKFSLSRFGARQKN